MNEQAGIIGWILKLVILLFMIIFIYLVWMSFDLGCLWHCLWGEDKFMDCLVTCQRLI